jgi:hypothetical protein
LTTIRSAKDDDAEALISRRSAAAILRFQAICSKLGLLGQNASRALTECAPTTWHPDSMIRGSRRAGAAHRLEVVEGKEVEKRSWSVSGTASPASVSIFYVRPWLFRILRIASWFVVLQGIVLGMLVIAVVGGTEVGVTSPVAVSTAAAAGLIPILASLVATCNLRIAAQMDLWAAPITPLLVFLFYRQCGGILPATAVSLGVLVSPGFFWLFAARRNWPVPLPSSLLSRRPRLAAVLGSWLSCVLVADALFGSLALPWWPRLGDCGGRLLLDERGVPRNIDFTARIMFVGPRTHLGRSLWSVAHIEERFSGLSWWAPDIVILRGAFQPSDTCRRYFVEGSCSHAVLTRYLPVIEPTPCGRTGPREYAAVTLRIPRDGPPKSGVRLIGRVYKGDRVDRSPVPGGGVAIDGPAGTIVSATDAHGIYDAAGLSPGRYTPHLAMKGASGRTSYGVESPVVDLKAGEIGGEDFYVW